MAAPSGIRPPHPLNLKESPIEGWKLFKQSWNNYVVITELQQKGNKYQKAMFLHCIGPEALKVYNTFNLPEDDTTKLEDIVTKFEDFIIGETNETYERYKFNQRNQLPEESTDQFLTALKTLSSTCNFCDYEGKPPQRQTSYRDKKPRNEKAPRTAKTDTSGRRGHLQGHRVCKRSQEKHHKAAAKVRNVETDSESESTYEWVNAIKGTIKCNILVKGKPVAFLIDSGASVNLLPVKYATHLVTSSTKPLRSFCDTVVDTKGISRQIITNPKTSKNYSKEFVVAYNECQPVIGLKAARQMKLLVIKENDFEQVASLAHSAIFNGELGSLPGKQHLTAQSP
ncbi:30S ribosomal protein s7p [Plakobranchus ocellatus]|uniref:30S ribosomal protein s7p n=1 Tax=Plakobranchus ocellatus TaxID=259542 RepID=A0AAV4C0F3_9GAST|nr:30S ribosomal protein s7p [Plakobranchus ocellatus]